MSWNLGYSWVVHQPCTKAAGVREAVLFLWAVRRVGRQSSEVLQVVHPILEDGSIGMLEDQIVGIRTWLKDIKVSGFSIKRAHLNNIDL